MGESGDWTNRWIDEILHHGPHPPGAAQSALGKAHGGLGVLDPVRA
jgi:hypothetical protein